MFPIDPKKQKYFCSSCNTEIEKPKAKFILTGKLIDSTTNIPVDIQDNPTEILLRISAEEYKSQNPDNLKRDIKFDEYCSSKYFIEHRIKL